MFLFTAIRYKYAAKNTNCQTTKNKTTKRTYTVVNDSAKVIFTAY